VGDTVEAQMGGNWTRVLVVAVQEDGYLVSVSDGAPQISVQKIRKGVFLLLLFFHFLSLLLIFFLQLTVMLLLLLLLGKLPPICAPI
jgi:hypothetical protein